MYFTVSYTIKLLHRMNNRTARVLGVVLVFFVGRFPCSCFVLSPGGVWSHLPAAVAGDSHTCCLLRIHWLFRLRVALHQCLIMVNLPFCSRFRGCNHFCSLLFTTPPSFGEGMSRVFSPCQACFSPVRSRLLLVSINPFVRLSWLFPVCIQVLIKLDRNTEY